MQPRPPRSSTDLHYRGPSLQPRPPPLGLALIPSGESGPSSMSWSSPSHGRRERRAFPSCGHAVATLLLPSPRSASAPTNMGGSVGAQLRHNPFPRRCPDTSRALIFFCVLAFVWRMWWRKILSNDEWVPHVIVYQFGFGGLYLGGVVKVVAKSLATKIKSRGFIFELLLELLLYFARVVKVELLRWWLQNERTRESGRSNI